MQKVEGKYVFIPVAILSLLTFAFIYKAQVKNFAKGVINYVFTVEQEHYLTDMHPKYQNIFRRFIAEAEKLGYKVLITSGYRSFQEQVKLHKENAQNAPAGKSMHNYGVALDLNLISKKDGSQLKKASTSKAWENTGIVKVAEKLGLKWGGGKNFGSYHDPVHFEVPLGGDKLYSLAIKQFGNESKVIGNRVSIA